VIVQTEQHPDDATWATFMVYFSASDPETGLNFFVVRMPKGRVRWAKGIAPAITKLVRALFTKEELAKSARDRRLGRESLVYWNVDGGHNNTLWHLQGARPTRYLWDGEALVKVPREAAAG
jgi:hypothetical protein